jgi:hypothetical protein
MIHMLVHPAAPVLRRQRSKERVRMPRALRISSLRKLPQLKFEFGLFEQKVTLVRHYQSLVGRITLRKWLFVRIDRSYERPINLPINVRGGLSRPEAMSSAPEQCAILCAPSLFPQSRWDAGSSRSMREISSSMSSRRNRLFISIYPHISIR